MPDPRQPYEDSVGAFELPDLRRLVATGKYRAFDIGRGRIEFTPSDEHVDASGGRAVVYELRQRTYS